jgi:hypothetical protein
MRNIWSFEEYRFGPADGEVRQHSSGREANTEVSSSRIFLQARLPVFPVQLATRFSDVKFSRIFSFFS